MLDQLKDDILRRLEEKLKKTTTVKDDLELLFTEWFHNLIVMKQMQEVQPEGEAE